jgi:hypothetical protein
MASKSYTRKDAAHYASQRLALKGCVLAGVPVRTAARRCAIPYSTAWLWVAQDGLRKADRAADAAGEARPEIGDWAKPGRGRAKAGQTGLPPADYPELKGVSGRKRLTALGELASTARMRAVAAIEEGCITFAMSALREAQRLDRAWRTLRDWLEMYPEAEAETVDADDWRAEVDEMMRAAEDGREPVYAPRPPLDPEEQAIWDAVYAAEAEDLARTGMTREDFTDEEFVLRELALAQEVWRIRDAQARWRVLPGRTPPPIVVRLPERWREGK